VVANAAPRQGDVYLRFNGLGNYVEIPSTVDYSIATTGELAVAAWIRPDTLNFPRWERTGYVHWLGKGEGAGDGGQQEWVFRIYNRDDTTENPPRPNRVSFYVFNPDGRLGVGSYFQDALQEGNWMFVVGVADTTRTYIYRDGRYRRCDTYRGPPDDCLVGVGRTPWRTISSTEFSEMLNSRASSMRLTYGCGCSRLGAIMAVSDARKSTFTCHIRPKG